MNEILVLLALLVVLATVGLPFARLTLWLAHSCSRSYGSGKHLHGVLLGISALLSTVVGAAAVLVVFVTVSWFITHRH